MRTKTMFAATLGILLATGCHKDEATAPSLTMATDPVLNSAGSWGYPDGMVSYWKFDEGGGTTALDAVNDNDGTILNGATWTDGVCGQALSFDGVDDYVDFGNDISLNSDIVTVELWVRPHRKYTGLVEKGWGQQDGWFLVYDDRNVCPSCVALFLNEPWDRIYSGTPDYSVTPEEWNHIAFVLTRSNFKIFTDGELSLDHNHSFDYRMNPERHLSVGQHMYLDHFYFEGVIDEVAIYNRALTAEEILQRYEYTAAGCAISVAIDIKPGSYPNSINLGPNGTVPVAIFSTETFDATTVDPTTVTLAGAAVKRKGKGTSMAAEEDVNDDGLMDLVVHVETQALTLTEGDTEAVLTGTTQNGLQIRGTDTVRVVP